MKFGLGPDIANPRTTTPVIGGLIVILSATITLLFIIIPFLADYPGYVQMGSYFVTFFGVRFIWLISSTLAIMGGILAIRRRNWWLAIIASVISIFDVIGVLGMLSIILIVASRSEFS